jgi:hypothetical protein
MDKPVALCLAQAEVIAALRNETAQRAAVKHRNALLRSMTRKERDAGFSLAYAVLELLRPKPRRRAA